MLRIMSKCLLTLIWIQIIDSIMALFRVDYSGRGELSERQQKVVPGDSPFH